MVPHACLNLNQRRLVENIYNPFIQSHGLPPVTVPSVPALLATAQRRRDVLAEIHAANPQIVVLLGDEPIEWFLSAFSNKWKKLASFGTNNHDYARLHPVTLGHKTYNILPLVHPRHAAGVGTHSTRWRKLHTAWVANTPDYAL